MGSIPARKIDWQFDIQHVAAQIRKTRDIDKRENIVVACIAPDGRSWPAWRQRHPNNVQLIRELVDRILKRVPGATVRVALTGHSGGGSFMFGFIEGGASIPEYVERIGFLDANYSFDDAEGHAEKLKAWLAGDAARRLVVLAYDDRRITLNGKLVVSETGGTYRASHRMIDSLGKDKPFTEILDKAGVFERYESVDAHAVFIIDKNPGNKILHTALVGDMNGLLMALTFGTPEASKWGSFGGPRAYTAWIQPAEFVSGTPVPVETVEIAPRKPSALGGEATLAPLTSKPYSEVEPTVIKEITNGNIPDFLRNFKTIHVIAIDEAGRKHTADYAVMPDYLCIGSDADFVRIPMTPTAAEKVAGAFGCVLPTRKMVDDIFAHAEVRFDPIPLAQDRESLQTFIFHNVLIQAQRESKMPGLLAAGDKKDVVISNRLAERPNRVAIYGWQRPDGIPIQPLTIIHRESYVDYSHGIRLVRSAMTVDGKPTTVAAVLKDPVLNILLSDEGPIIHATYEQD
jgi:hypothetical protein